MTSVKSDIDSYYPPLDDNDDPNEIDLAWEGEIGRRLKEFREGRIVPVSEEEAFRRLRAAVRNQ